MRSYNEIMQKRYEFLGIQKHPQTQEIQGFEDL